MSFNIGRSWQPGEPLDAGFHYGENNQLLDQEERDADTKNSLYDRIAAAIPRSDVEPHASTTDAHDERRLTVDYAARLARNTLEVFPIGGMLDHEERNIQMQVLERAVQAVEEPQIPEQVMQDSGLLAVLRYVLYRSAYVFGDLGPPSLRARLIKVVRRYPPSAIELTEPPQSSEPREPEGSEASDDVGHNIYSGANITAAEMRGSYILQALVDKDALEDDWQSEADDLEFESGAYFLTGLAQNIDSRDSGTYPRFMPPRHNTEELNADEHIFMEPEETGMPFHPYCFEIFSRVSRLRLACLDVHGLMSWRVIEGEYGHVPAFIERDPAVRKGSEQWWEHCSSDEWVAANPVLIPRWQEALNKTLIQEAPAKTDKQAYLDPRSDPFMKLPEELRISVAALLEFKDITSLRKASRCFTLPQSIFENIIKKDWVWVYEGMPPSLILRYTLT